MPVTKEQCLDFVCRYVANYASVPLDWIGEKTEFSRLNFSSADFTELAREMNQAHWHDAYLWPGELVGSKTVGDAAAILFKEASKA